MASLSAWVVRLTALAALGLSAFLLWTSLHTEASLGCDFASFDCEAALGSRWAKWFGLPVAGGGVLCYLAAVAGSWLAPKRDFGWRLLEFASPLALGAGVWFVVIQATQLESFCLWCVLTHSAGAAMAVAAFVWRRGATIDAPTPIAIGPLASGTNEPTGAPPLGAPTACAIVGLAALVIGQALFAPEETIAYEPEIDESFAILDTPAPAEPIETAAVEPNPDTPEAGPESPDEVNYPRKANGSRLVTLLKGRLKVDAYDHPVVGSPEAPHVIVELMDYACPHCREFHDALLPTLEAFDGRVAVVVMPVPGEKVCNPYVSKARPNSVGACYAAKLSLAVSRVDPLRFSDFHEWMLEAENIPSRTASLIAARERVDSTELSAELRDEQGELAARIKQNVELAAAISRQGRFGLPTLILGDKILISPPKDVDRLSELLSDEFDLPLPTAELSF